MTEEEKLRLKILKIKARRLSHRGMRWAKNNIKKTLLFMGLGLISVANAHGQGFKNLLASAQKEYKSNAELFAWVEKQSQVNPEANAMVSDEISNQIRYLAEELMFARNDSLSSSIDRLRNTRTRTKEIRNNFQDAVGYSRVAFHCLATQCAADYRALKAMGLEGIIPADLRQASALCSAYVKHADIKPFSYEVENTEEAIKTFIREHNLSGGCLIFYPRDRKGNYHAVALDMPDGDFFYNDSTDEILTSSANIERKGVPVRTGSFQKKAPGRKAIIVDKLGFFIAMLERYVEGKTLAEQTAFLYRGGAEEFMNHLQQVTNQNKETLVASIDNLIGVAPDTNNDPRMTAGLYLLAVVSLAGRRKNGKKLFEMMNKLEEYDSVVEKIEYLNANNGKDFSDAMSALSSKERQQFMGILRKSGEDRYGQITDANLAALTVATFAHQHEVLQTWHEVAETKKTMLPPQTKKTKPSVKNTTVKPKQHVRG